MPDNFTEPEETNTFNPLDEPVNEKSYAKVNAKVKPEDLNKPIPEPSFDAPPLADDVAGNNNSEAKKEPVKPFDQQINDLPTKDKNAAGLRAAEMILDGYEGAHMLAYEYYLSVSPKDIRKIESKGEIDLNLQIPFSPTQMATGGEIIADYNAQVKDVLVVSQEFKDKVIPPLQRVLSKHGVGLTDEKLLLYLFGKDIAVKGVQVMQIKSTMNSILDVLKEHTAMMRSGAYGPPPQPAPAQQPDSYPPQTQEPEEIVYEQEVSHAADPLNVNTIVEEITNPDKIGKEVAPPQTKRRGKFQQTKENNGQGV